MSGCEKLSIIPTNICKLKSLSKLDLDFCTNLESFPEIMEPMESLTILSLKGCKTLKRFPDSFHNLKSLQLLKLGDLAITELPSSIQHLTSLETLDISGCQNLTSLPSSIHNLINLTGIDASHTGIVVLPESICQLFKMKHLYLNGCKRLRSLPANMKQLSQLLSLGVPRCSNLSSLPELPSSLWFLNADGCVSLKTIPYALFSSESRTIDLFFANCCISDEELRRIVLDIAFKEILNSNPMILLMLPWSTEIPQCEIPQWFCASQSVGCSLTLKLPMDDQCYRLVFCVVIKPNYANSIDRKDSFHWNRMECFVDDDANNVTCRDFYGWSDTEHLLLWGNKELKNFGRPEISLQFRDAYREVEVTRCGVVIL